MIGRVLVISCVAIPAAYYAGIFGHSGVDRVVAKTPSEVRSGLMNLDIRDAPGSPATDPTQSGNVAPDFQLTQEGNDMVWTVMSGNAVAVRMIAHLEPVENGTETHVTSEVQRGNAPDDLVTPAFRSTGTTLGLFSTVLEDELDKITRPLADADTCRKILDDFQGNGFPAEDTRGFAGVAKQSMRLSALETKLKAAGCDTSFGKFEEPKDELSGTGGAEGPNTSRGNEVSFVPGQPMINVSKDARPGS